MPRKMIKNIVGEEKADIDLTPMLDVVFILLIFFVVTASFLRESGIGINQPENQPETSKKKELLSLLISIDSQDDIYIENRQVDMHSVKSLVTQHLAENSKAQVIIRAHEMASASSYVTVADMARKAPPARI